MPYSSKAQQGWAHTPAGIKALGGKSKVAEWDSASKGIKLPKRAKKKVKIVDTDKDHDSKKDTDKDKV